MKRSVFFRATALFFIALSSTTWGADAFFSPDGKTIITTVQTSSEITGLAKIDIATGKVTALPLTAAFKDAEISSVARGAEGEILFLAKDAVWVLKGTEAPRKVVSTSAVKNATGLFVGTKKGSPLEDWLFVSGVEDDKNNSRGTFYARKPGGKKFESIFCRRVEDATSGMFANDGRMFFVSSGDVWEGIIAPETDSEGQLGVLVGARFAPLAFLNTDAANAGGMWVGEACPAGKWIYCALHGHHMGAIVRAPLPTKALYTTGGADGESGGFPTVKAAYGAMSLALGKAEVIVEDLEDIYGLCAAEVDGKPLVFFYSRPGEDGKGPPLMLWNGAGEPKVIGHLPKAKGE